MHFGTSGVAGWGALGLAVLVASGCRTEDAVPGRGGPAGAADRAIPYLARAVPAWRRDNHCFSCHHNGDGARALYAAAHRGHRIAPADLAETSDWLLHPARWEHNRGDPAFSDQRLARLQFSFALLTGWEFGQFPGRDARQAVDDAAKRVAGDQDADGSWPVEPQNPVGSPVTYGTPLATYVGWRVLEAARLRELQSAASSARAWLLRLEPRDTPSAAVVLMTSARLRAGGTGAVARAATALLQRAQTPSGGWGPYPDAPAEPFDTALALLALAEARGTFSAAEEMIGRGRRYLEASQEADGSWPASTRPPGEESYAQKVSTTSWALLALLRTDRRR